MTATLMHEPLSLLDAAEREPTLDEVVSRVWHRLSARVAVECPACSETMRPDHGTGARPVGGTCSGCGTRLS